MQAAQRVNGKNRTIPAEVVSRASAASTPETAGRPRARIQEVVRASHHFHALFRRGRQRGGMRTEATLGVILLMLAAAGPLGAQDDGEKRVRKFFDAHC